jgi:muramoyltetrapeptide carboxypeptidase
MKTIIPPYLKPGDTIGITCPAGFMAVDKALTCINTLQAWGYRVQSGNLLGGGSQNYFSGSDDERIDELQMMLDDPNIKAIMFARGGYGMGRIIDYLSFKRFRKHPKWLIGFSDITVIQMHIFAQYNIASLHAPMAAAFNDGEEDNEYIRSLRYALEGKPAHYTFPTHAFNKAGTATGKLVGGNLALVAHLIGTSSEVDTENKILFL